MLLLMRETGKLTHPTYYQAYLLRLWRDDAASPWRVVVTQVSSGEQHHFASLDACFVFIGAEAGTAVDQPQNQA